MKQDAALLAQARQDPVVCNMQKVWGLEWTRDQETRLCWRGHKSPARDFGGQRVEKRGAGERWTMVGKRGSWGTRTVHVNYIIYIQVWSFARASWRFACPSRAGKESSCGQEERQWWQGSVRDDLLLQQGSEHVPHGSLQGVQAVKLTCLGTLEKRSIRLVATSHDLQYIW